MGELVKARLQEIAADESRAEVGDPVEVQFNPTTLQLRLTNQVDNNKSAANTPTQHLGSTSAVLSLELVFDTADEGTTDAPRSVREKTALVERYARPREAGEEVVPKLRFQWNDLVFEGVVESVSVDLDHFASNGTPLRAKVSLSIQEQDPTYRLASPRSGPAPLPGAAGAGAVGVSAGAGFAAGTGLSIQAGSGAQVGLALGGESAAQFAARVGVDPAAWRGLDVDLSAGLELEAGAEVGFDAGLSVSAGLGSSSAPDAGAGASLESSFGLEAQPAAGAGGGAAAAAAGKRSAGFALAAAGGVEAAVETVRGTRAERAAAATREAFDLGGESGEGEERSTARPAAAGRPVRPSQSRTPMRLAGVPAPARGTDTPAPPPPRADRRATSYGFGVPLRRRVPVATGTGGDGPAERRTATTPPWEGLPPADRVRAAADSLQEDRTARRVCGCRGRCRGHGGAPYGGDGGGGER